MNFMEKICTGTPEEGGSHFRMILPMAWRSVLNQDIAGFEEWKESVNFSAPKKNDPRWKYFTRETATLLGYHALWIEPTNIDGWPQKITLTHGGDAEDVSLTTCCLSQPRLVLFEAKVDRLLESDSPLHVAFLVIDVHIESIVTMQNFLTVMEVLRYWEVPFENLYGERKIAGLMIDGKNVENHYKCLWSKAFGRVAKIQIGQRNFVLSTPGGEFPLEAYFPDNRAFVCSFCSFEKGGKDGKLASAIQQSLNDNWASNDGELAPWIKLLNVDNVKPNADFMASKFEAEWAKPRTYLRCAHFRTLHGFTTHSYCWLYEKSADQKWNEKMVNDFRTHYTDLTLYSFYLRQVLMRFNAQLFNITKNLPLPQADETRKLEIRDQYGQLRAQYLRFENLYRFPLFTTQQQPLEMYEIQQREMDIPVLYEEMSKQIQNSDEYFAAKIAEAQSKQLENINYLVVLSTVAAIASVVVAVADLDNNHAHTAIISLIFGVLLTTIAFSWKNFKNDI